MESFSIVIDVFSMETLTVDYLQPIVKMVQRETNSVSKTWCKCSTRGAHTTTFLLKVSQIAALHERINFVRVPGLH